jgi:nitrite reductase (NO-forming)
VSVTTERPRRAGPGRSGARGFWPLRDLPVLGWLAAAAVVAFVHPFVPEPRWLLLHLLLLGAAGHAILVWSRYFADTLLRVGATPRARQSVRLAMFDLGALVVTAGVVGGRWPVVLLGALGVVAAVLWHVATLLAHLRGRFSSRFAATVHYYVAAGTLLPVGAALGVWMAVGIAEPLDTRVRLAHVTVNILGWVGLTVLGTLVTLWPTMLRTRIDERSERLSRAALPTFVAAIATVAAGAAADATLLSALGLAAYLAGVLVLARPWFAVTLRKPPSSFPTWSVAAGLTWFVGCLSWLLVGVLRASGWVEVGGLVQAVAPYLAAGFVAQVLLGALSYLVPVVLGGGPAVVRATNRAMDAGGALRVTVTNLGLLVCVLPVPSLVRVVASVLVLGALAVFVPVLLRAVAARHRGVDAADGSRPRGQNAGLAAVGVALVVLAVAGGAALDPAALGRGGEPAAAGVAPTGRTVEVDVDMRDMRFEPDRIEVDAGDRLVVTVRNVDTDVHDLVLESGHDSGRLAPGEEAVVDVGVVGRGLEGWCSVVGHRQMGMTLRVDARGASDDTGEEVSGQADGEVASAAGGEAARSAPDALGGHAAAGSASAPGFEAHDPVLPPLGTERVHRHTLRVSQVEREVAPGVTQELWTFGGTAPGPTLHGRVGDRFEITLVNDGTIGHSIDFHAGVRAPDEVMRTIAPGESLVYRFTATRAGIWMYHCSTMPMSAHIANGMFGAVVIEPPDLPAVDRSYVLVQSEQYYGPQGGPVDMDALLDEQPDAVVFNGYADQYHHAPLRFDAGDRVRIWVLDAGPSRASSFHVVGGQFDTVFSEGAWLLGGPGGPSRDGGAQVLPLLPAQGGFVELTLDEPGNYPFVSHAMVDAERGARGLLHVH